MQGTTKNYFCMVLLIAVIVASLGSSISSRFDRNNNMFTSQYAKSSDLESLFDRLVSNQSFTEFEMMFPTVTAYYLDQVLSSYNQTTMQKTYLLALAEAGIESAHIYKNLAKIYAIEGDEANRAKYERKVEAFAPNRQWSP